MDVSDQSLNKLKKLDTLKAKFSWDYPSDFRPENKISELIRFGQDNAQGLEAYKEKFKSASFKAAGRVMSLRRFGKAAFFHVQDDSASIQVFIEKASVQEGTFELLKLIDIGDIVGLDGWLFLTKTKELTLHATALSILAKSLHPMPEKWHGLTDKELRFRMRYLDLIVNSAARDTIKKRAYIIAHIRQFLTNHGFLEVQTPMFHPIPGGAAARPFVTRHNALNRDLYLRIAPELYLKQLLVGGFEKVFEIGRCFRNEGLSNEHNPEFTIMECYQAYATYEDMMNLTESLISELAERFTENKLLKYQDQTISLEPPFKKITLKEAITQVTGLKEVDLKKDVVIRGFLEELGIEVNKDESRAKMLLNIFEKVAEPTFIQPTFVINYPVEVSPLAKRSIEDPTFVDRFECFVLGREIANAFSELNDPIEQRERFLKEAEKRAKGDEEALYLDEGFLRALEYGMPPAAGLGMGIDRLVMLFTDSYNIREVIAFPLLRHVCGFSSSSV